jgi:hypothetical protein
MTGKELDEKWAGIIPPKNNLYSYQRIDSICIPNLCVGITSETNRCVILKLRSTLKFEFKDESKENLKTYFDTTENALVLELTDSFFNNLFTDLIISLYQNIKDLDNEDHSTQLFINTVRYWSDFLKSKRNDFLSDEVVQGLYGELVYLEMLLHTSNSPINEILESWKGPYDANQDFHFTEKNVEIKTKRKNGNIINIASEHQLESEVGKALELAVVSIIPVKEHGDTLKGILDRIREKTLKAGGSISIISDALGEKKLNFSNVAAYDYLQFRPECIEVFDCDNKAFPKLISSELDHAVHGVTYKLALTSIKPDLLMNTIDLK